jgi:hypothetical protein
MFISSGLEVNGRDKHKDKLHFIGPDDIINLFFNRRYGKEVQNRIVQSNTEIFLTYAASADKTGILYFRP